MKHLILILSLVGLTLFISGCQGGPRTPKKPDIDSTLPRVENIKTLSDINAIAFEWSPTYNERVVGYYIYRVDPNSQTMDRVAVINDRYVSHYVDTKLKPQSNYKYKMSTFSDAKQESMPSDLVDVSTVANIETVPYLTTITGLPNRSKLIWRPHPSLRVSSYAVERSEILQDKWKEIAIIEGRLNAEYIDKGLKDNKGYKYRVRVKTFDGLVSAPSQAVEVQTKPLPLVVENLRASNDLPKKIILNWDATTQEDAVYYKIYRATHPSLFYSYLAKTTDTQFEDLINDNGAARYYYVRVVDKDELESPKQKNPVMGTTVAAPNPPLVNVVKNDERSVTLGWNDISNKATKFQVVKKFNGESVVFTNIKRNSFVDKDVSPGVSYSYTIFAIDKFGIMSKASEKIVVVIPQD